MWHMFAPQQVYSGGIGNAPQTPKVHQNRAIRAGRGPE
jgi:hypothetical protein